MRSLVALLLCVMFLAPASASAAFARLEAPLAYTARAEANGVVYEAFLRLGKRNFFVLTERALLPQGRVEERSLTGKWRQTDEGALVRLTSRQGLSRRFNVGGAGDLYGHMQDKGAMFTSLRFVRATDSPRPYTLSGTLLFPKDGEVAVRDAATGRVAAFEPDPRLDALAAREEPLFAELEVEEEGGTMRLVRVRSVSARLPVSLEREQDIAALADGSMWRFAPKGLPPLVGRFASQGEGGGTLDVTGEGVHLPVTWRSEGESLTFRVAEQDARTTRAAGYGALLELFGAVRSWDVEGDMVILYNGSSTLGTMELMTPGGGATPHTGTVRADKPGVARQPLAASGTAWTGWVRP